MADNGPQGRYLPGERPASGSIRAGVERLVARLPAVYIIVFFAMTTGVLLYQPVSVGDTDIWFHLTAGRFMFAHHALPHCSFFSFLTPPRPLYDYSWLFQLMVFTVYSMGGYPGLIILRTAVFAGTLMVIGRFLFGKGYRTPTLYGCVVFSLCALFLFHPYLLVRPYMFSFFLIPVFLLILESRGKWLPVLPLLTLLWGNIHGIECPLVCLILGSYMAECLFQPRPENPPADRQRFLVFSALALLAVFATPLGLRLFEIAASSRDVSFFRRLAVEMQALHLSELASFHVSGGKISFDTCFNALLVLSGLSGVAALTRRKARLSHFLLMAGGLYLLTRATRLRFECLLLLLPVIKANPPFEEEAASRLFPAPVLAVLATVLLLLPYLYLKPLLEYRRRYPFSAMNLPQGVVSFLRYIKSDGNVWNEPAPGGYLEWMLYPRYLIAADLHFIPHFFNDSDLYMAQESFRNRGLLCRVIHRYAPDFIIASLLNPDFPGMIAAFPEYVLVFFDDTSALYVNRLHRPDVAKTYALRENPYYVDWRFPVPDPALASARMPVYLPRMLEIDPESLITRWRAAAFCSSKGDFNGELVHAEIIIRNYPENRFGYLVKGNALRQLKRFDEALSALRQALERKEGPVGDDVVELEMVFVYQARGQFAQADRLLDVLEPDRPPRSWAREQAGKAGPAPERRKL